MPANKSKRQQTTIRGKSSKAKARPKAKPETVAKPAPPAKPRAPTGRAKAPPRDQAAPSGQRAALLGAVIDHVPQGVCVVGSDLCLSMANDRFATLLGLPKRLTRPGTPFADIIRHNAARGDYGPVKVETIVAERLSYLRQTRNYGNQRALPDGRVLDIKGARMGDAGYVITYTDVTERAKTEREAALAHERLRNAIEAFNEGFALWDKDDRLVMCNAHYREVYADFGHLMYPGISYEEHVRGRLQSPLSLVPPDQVEQRVRERIAQRKRGIAPLDVERADDRWVRVIDRHTESGDIVSIRIDISDFKQQQRALTTQSQLLQTVLETMADGLVAFDGRDRLITVNDRAAAILGLARESLVPGLPLDTFVRAVAERGFFGPGDPIAVAAKRIAYLRERGSATDELAREDGTCLEVRRNTLPDGGFVTTFQDVTARRRAEREREQASRRLLDAIESIPQGFVLFDASRHVVTCNKAFAGLYGKVPEEMVGLSVKEVSTLAVPIIRSYDGAPIDPDGEWVERRARRFAEGLREPVEVELHDGRWLLNTDLPTSDGGVVFVRTDITEQKRAQARLRDSEALKSAVIDSSPDPIVTLDHHGIILEFNPAAERVFGHGRGTMIGRGLCEIVELPPGPVSPADDFVRYLTSAPSLLGKRIELQGKRADGMLFPAELAINEVPLVGKTVFTAYLRDISERQRMEQALRESEQRFRQIAEAQPLPVTITRVSDGQVVYANARAAEMVRGTVEQLQALQSTWFYADSTARDEVIAEIQATGKVDAKEVLFRRLDGSLFWLALTCHRIVYQGEPAIVSGFHELTERKKMEQALRDSEQRFRNIAEAHPVPVVIIRLADGLIVHASPSLATLTGGADYVGVHTSDYFDRDARRRFMQELKTTGAVEEFELVMRRQDGSTFPAMVTARPIEWEGEHAVVMGIVELTERKAMEEALRESEQRFRQIAEAHPVPVVITRMQDGFIRYASRSMAAVTGLEDCAGRHIIEFYADPSDRPRLLAAIEKSGSIKDYEIGWRRADGSELPVAITSKLTTWDGERCLISGIVDLTERKHNEAEIARQREALAHSEKLTALGSLLAGVAHELNNPLSVVVGQAAMLQEAAQNADIATRAERIRAAAERCARIVKTFLAMARRRPPELRAVNLNVVIESAVDLVAYQLRTADVALEMSLSTDLPALHADGDQLGQVVTNLLVNAQQALMERAPPRRLSIATQFDRAANVVTLRIADNGPGVPQDIRARIFDPFFTTKPTGLGTGVGLSMCHGVVTSHGGTITLAETPGGGATFVVSLPVRQATESAVAQARAEPAPKTGAATILLVDDEPEVAQTLAEILEAAGHRVDTAANGRVALERIAAERYDLILSDLRMPVLDGPGLYHAMADMYTELLDRIVFITGDTLAPHVNAFLAQTRVACLEKPLDPRAVQDFVADFLAKRRHSPAGGRPTKQ